jgi:hypothetical protein
MTLILSGTDGLSDVDGSAATPAIRGTDANTGIFFPAADTIAFSEGGTEAMRIDSSGNVGIGTSSPAGRLHVNGQTYIQGSVSGGLANSTLVGNNAGQAQFWGLGADTSTTGSMTFVVARSNLSSSIQAMTLDSSGNVGIGTTAPNKNLEVVGTIRVSRPSVSATYMEFFGGSGSTDPYINVPSGFGIPFNVNGTEYARVEPSTFKLTSSRVQIVGASAVPGPVSNGDGSLGTYAQYGVTLIGKGSSYDICFFNKNGSIAGYVATGATTITTSSDERLKENNQPITGALDAVCQMRHETGNYKSDPDRTVAFLIAQDVDALFPYAVEKADPESWGVNYNWIIPLHGAAITELTALVKEQQAIITSLTDRITALEAK